MPPGADDLIHALRSPDAIAAADLVDLADWLAEDVAQQLYAIRQDIAELESEQPRVVKACDDLLHVVHSISGISEALRGGPAGATRLNRRDAAMNDAQESTSDARALTAQSRLLGARNVEIRRAVAHQRKIRDDGPDPLP